MAARRYASLAIGYIKSSPLKRLGATLFWAMDSVAAMPHRRGLELRFFESMDYVAAIPLTRLAALSGSLQDEIENLLHKGFAADVRECLWRRYFYVVEVHVVKFPEVNKA